MAILEVQHVSKSFGHTEVLKDISFSLEKGKVLSLIGSSGSGKTTLLRCLNFLERPDGGVIRVNGETLFDAGDRATMQESEIRRKRLHFGLVFQSFNLFPQYTALQNVMLARNSWRKKSRTIKRGKRRSTHRSRLWQGLSWTSWGCQSGWIIIPTSSPADSAREWPSPGRWR